jgi:hypothetical protein
MIVSEVGHYRLFFEFLAAGMGDDRQLRRKPFDVFGLSAEVALRVRTVG